MRRAAHVLIVIAAALSIGAAARYMMTPEYMPYHAVVTGQPWKALPPGLQAVIVGMLRILAGGFLGCGLALLALVYATRSGAIWPFAACLVVGIAVWLPVVLVTLMLKSFESSANPPTGAATAVLALVTVGSAMGLVSGRRSAA